MYIVKYESVFRRRCSVVAAAHAPPVGRDYRKDTLALSDACSDVGLQPTMEFSEEADLTCSSAMRRRVVP